MSGGPARAYGGGVEGRVAELERKQNEGPFGDPAAVRTTLDVYSKAESAALIKSGFVVGSAYAEYTTNADLSVAIPFDDTIPQIGEGTQIISASITPTSITNKIRIHFSAMAASGVATTAVAAAVFRNGGASAIGTGITTVAAANNPYNIAFSMEHTPGATTAQTYTVRVGPNSGTCRLNGYSTSRLYGGTARATLILEEIKA